MHRSLTWTLAGQNALEGLIRYRFCGSGVEGIENDGGSSSRRLGDPFHAPIYCAPTPPHSAPSCSLGAPSCFLGAPSVLSLAPSVLPLKWPCSLSRSKAVISNPKFGVYIIYIYCILKIQIFSTATLLPREGPLRAFTPLMLPHAPSMLPYAPSVLPLYSL